MDHKQEITQVGETLALTAAQQKAAILSDTYRRLFSTEDGKKVLEDLTKKFGSHRPRFSMDVSQQSTITAAVIDGQASVINEINSAIKASA